MSVKKRERSEQVDQFIVNHVAPMSTLGELIEVGKEYGIREAEIRSNIWVIFQAGLATLTISLRIRNNAQIVLPGELGELVK